VSYIAAHLLGSDIGVEAFERVLVVILGEKFPCKYTEGKYIGWETILTGQVHLRSYDNV
jgi:hypothetical protein